MLIPGWMCQAKCSTRWFHHAWACKDGHYTRQGVYWVIEGNGIIELFTVHVAIGPAKHRRHAEHSHVCAAAHFFSLDHPLIQELLRVPSELKRIHPVWDFFFFLLSSETNHNQTWPGVGLENALLSMLRPPQSFHLNHYWPILLWWCLDLVLFFIPVWPGTYSRSSDSSLQALGLQLRVNAPGLTGPFSDVNPSRTSADLRV